MTPPMARRSKSCELILLLLESSSWSTSGSTAGCCPTATWNRTTPRWRVPADLYMNDRYWV